MRITYHHRVPRNLFFLADAGFSNKHINTVIHVKVNKFMLLFICNPISNGYNYISSQLITTTLADRIIVCLSHYLGIL